MHRLFWLSLVMAIGANGCKKNTPPTAEKAAAPTTASKTPDADEDLGQRVQKYFNDLKAIAPERRAAAIDQTPRLEGEGAELVSGLLEALKDPSSSPLGDTLLERAKSTREAAVLALLKLGAPGKKALLDTGLKTLISGLSDTKPAVREHTANAIGMIGPDAKSAADSLIKLCSDKEGPVRNAAYRSLERIKTFSSTPILKLLSHSDPTVCVDAALALSWMKPTGDEAVNALIDALKSTELEKKSPAAANTVRLAAAEALGVLGKAAEKAVPALVETIKKSDIEKFEQALNNSRDGRGMRATGIPGHIVALQKIGTPALAPLQELLKDREPIIRYQAAMAIGGMGKLAESALPDIVMALESERNLANAGLYVFEELVTAALNLGGDPAQILNPIIVLLRDQDNIIKARAAALVKRIGRRAAPTLPRLLDLLKEGDERILVQATGAIEVIGPPAREAVSDLMRLLEHERPEVVRGAAAALRSIGPAAAPAVPALIKALESSNQNITSEIAGVIGSIGPDAESAVPALVKYLNDKNSRAEDRQAILQALTQIGTKATAALPDVIRMINDRDNPTKIAAIQAATAIGPGKPETIIRLIEAFKDASLQVQIASIRAIAQMGKTAASADSELKKLAESGKEGERQTWAMLAMIAHGVDVDKYFKVVQEALRNKTPAGRNSRGAAVDGLYLLGSKVKLLTAEVTDVLKDKTTAGGNMATLRERAAISIGKLGVEGKPFLSGLIDLLRDTEPRVRRAAIIALGQIGPDALLAAPKLREMIGDEYGALAQQALDRIDPPAKKDMP